MPTPPGAAHRKSRLPSRTTRTCWLLACCRSSPASQIPRRALIEELSASEAPPGQARSLAHLVSEPSGGVSVDEKATDPTDHRPEASTDPQTRQTEEPRSDGAEPDGADEDKANSAGERRSCLGPWIGTGWARQDRANRGPERAEAADAAVRPTGASGRCRHQVPVIRHQMLPRPRHQRIEPLHQHLLRHHHHSRAIPPTLLQRAPNPATTKLHQPRLGHRRNAGVTA